MANHPSESFPPEVRIVRSSEYRSLYKAGKKIHSDSFILFWRENGKGHHRLGLTVSRKVGNAVIRNRVKRLFREIFRKARHEIPGHFDLLVNAKSGCGNMDYLDAEREFLAAAHRISQSG